MSEELEHDPSGADVVLERAGARLREGLDAREQAWEQLAAGDLDEAGVRARLDGEGHSEEGIAHGVALFTPLEDARLDALEDRLFAQLDAPAPSEPAREEPPASAPIDLSAARRRRNNVIAGVVTVLAAAALALVWIRGVGPRGQAGSGVGTQHGGAELVAYSLEHGAGAAVVRSEHASEGQELRYVSGDRFRWILRPDDDSELAPAWRAYARAAGEQGPPRVLEVEGLSERGGASLRLSGRIEELGLAPGTWDLIFVLAPSEAQLPAELPLAQLATLTTHAQPDAEMERGWIALGLRVRVEAAP